MVAGVFALWYSLPMRPLKSLTLETFMGKLSGTFRKMVDSRAAARVKYSLHDTGERFCDDVFSASEPPPVSAADGATNEGGAIRENRRISSCCCFTVSPILRFALNTISWVKAVPSDTQMREILDGAASRSGRAAARVV
jgi:hypothetical protein